MTQHREFLETHLGDMKGNAIMAIATGRTATGKLEIRESQWFKYPEQLDQMVEYAEKERSGDRRNVYYSPAIYGDQKGPDGNPSRAKTNALWAQTVYLDSDSCPPEAYRIPPSTHVQTSEANGQDYWILPEPVPVAEASEMAHRMALAHKDDGCDPSSWSANKFLRMPTFNTKDAENVWSVVWETNGSIWDIADLGGAYDDVEVPKKVQGRQTLVTPTAIPTPEGLPDYMTLLGMIPETERRLNELILKTPKGGDDGWRSEQRYALLLDLIRFGFTLEETVSIAWHCPAAEKWRNDDRGIGGLWGEATKARAEVEYERGQAPDTPKPVRKPSREEKPAFSILSAEERLVFDRSENWIRQYCAWAGTRVKMFNAPYHTINAWTVLSLAFSAFAYIPKLSGPMPLNIFSMSLGNSSTGKTEATDLMWLAIRALYPHDSPDIGGNHSENALIERLLARDGKPSIMHTDEADGLLATWAQGSWAVGIQSTVTKLYDGKVPQLGRVGRADLQVDDARAAMTSHFMGTPTGMMKVLTPAMFKTGFLARQIWAIGNATEVRREDIKFAQVVGNQKRIYDAMPKYWSSRFLKIRETLRAGLPLGDRQVPVLLTDEAGKRFEDAQWAIIQQAKKIPGDSEIYTTTTRRMFDVIWKATALLALSDGRQMATLEDMIVALGYAEGWLADMTSVVDKLADSAFSTACDSIEAFIAGREGHEAEASLIYNFRKGEPMRVTEEYLKSLLAQRRITERAGRAGGPRFYKIKES